MLTSGNGAQKSAMGTPIDAPRFTVMQRDSWSQPHDSPASFFVHGGKLLCFVPHCFERCHKIFVELRTQQIHHLEIWVLPLTRLRTCSDCPENTVYGETETCLETYCEMSFLSTCQVSHHNFSKKSILFEILRRPPNRYEP